MKAFEAHVDSCPICKKVDALEAGHPDRNPGLLCPVGQKLLVADIEGENTNSDEFVHYAPLLGRTSCGLTYNPVKGKPKVTMDAYRVRGCKKCMDATGVWSRRKFLRF